MPDPGSRGCGRGRCGESDRDDCLDERSREGLLPAECAGNTSEPVRGAPGREPDLRDQFDDDADHELRPEDPGDTREQSEEGAGRER